MMVHHRAYAPALRRPLLGGRGRAALRTACVGSRWRLAILVQPASYVKARVDGKDRHVTMTTTTSDARRQPLIIFLHNMKTGGSTLQTIIARQYDPDAVYFEGPRRHSLQEIEHLRRLDFEKVRFIQGHIPFGLHAVIPCKSAYVTLLRHPVERIISLYHYVSGLPGSKIHRQSQASLRSLDEFASSGLLLEADNGQTRRLSGISPAFGQCTTEMLEKAKRNIREYFSVAGLCERFDESLILMKRLFGWRSVLYLRKMVSANRQRRESLSPDTLAAILEHNALDLELYTYAEGLLDEAISRQPGDFAAEVRSFKSLNAELAAQAAGAQPASPSKEGLRAALLDAHVDFLAREDEHLEEMLRLRRRQDRLARQVAQLATELPQARNEIRQMQATRVWRLGAWYWETRAGLKGMLQRVSGVGSRVSGPRPSAGALNETRDELTRHATPEA
jgi:hypothetical protein